MASRFIQASMRTSPVSCCWAMAGTRPAESKRMWSRRDGLIGRGLAGGWAGAEIGRPKTRRSAPHRRLRVEHDHGVAVQVGDALDGVAGGDEDPAFDRLAGRGDAGDLEFCDLLAVG